MNDTIRRQPDLPALFQIAVGQQGYFTAAQAHEHAVSKDLVKYHLGTGRFQRAHRGVYRFRDYPPSPREHVASAWLAVGRERAVVSHESALDLYELSDVIPWGIDITIPRQFRATRPPDSVRLHTSTRPLPQGQVRSVDGMNVTSPARTIVDVAASGRSLEHVFTAVQEALDRGLTTTGELKQLAEDRSRRVRDLIDMAIGAAKG